MASVLDIIDEALKARGLSDAEASRLASGNPALIKNMRNTRGEKARPNFHAIERLADVLGLELYFGPPRERAPDPPGADHELTYLPRYDVAAAAGNGSHAPDQERPVSHVAFRTDWLRAKGIVAAKAALVDVRGNSMEPDLHDGDLVLVDMRPIPPRPGASYVFRDADDTIRVKRLASTHEALYFISANDDHPTEARTGPDAARIHIIGRVVWFARTLD